MRERKEFLLLVPSCFKLSKSGPGIKSEAMPEAKDHDHSERHGQSAASIISETFYGGGTGAGGQVPGLTLPMASRKDVDFLVQELKENLKLSHGLKSRSTAMSHRASHRASPYPRVPNPSRQCDSAADLVINLYYMFKLVVNNFYNKLEPSIKCFENNLALFS